METGLVTRWNEVQGFGFVKPDYGTGQVFVHISAFADGKAPKEGDRIAMRVQDTPKGLRAMSAAIC